MELVFSLQHMCRRVWYRIGLEHLSSVIIFLHIEVSPFLLSLLGARRGSRVKFLYIAMAYLWRFCLLK